MSVKDSREGEAPAEPLGQPSAVRREAHPPTAASPDAALLRAGDSVLFIDRKEREYLRTLKVGGQMHLRGGSIAADDLIGRPEGRVIENRGGEPFLVLRPTFASLIPHLPRRAQVIYPKDLGPILIYGDIAPGIRVLEVGTGPGALTMALLRAVGPSGQVISYEIRPEFADMARANVEQFFGAAPHWVLKVADVHEGICERDLDRMVIDLAEPWRVLSSAATALRPGGVLIVWVPTVLQVKQFVDEARTRGFGAVQVMETLHRPWHVAGLSIRPEHRMVAHTGFLIIARRLADGEPLRRLGGAATRGDSIDAAADDDSDDDARPDTE
jgi:tRNA (adenine57-N1/adenine58-N1)-methyltransferase